MKKIGLVFLAVLLVACVFASGCAKDGSLAPLVQTTATIICATPTPIPNEDNLYINANVRIHRTVQDGHFYLSTDATNTTKVTNAVVKVNGTIVNQVAPGIYYRNLGLFAAGVAVNVSITTPAGTVNISGVMPVYMDPPLVINVAGAVAGSTLTLSHD